jgi:hypothetical protein
VASPVLKFKHHRSEAPDGNLVTSFLAVVLADERILAIHAPEITVSEKDISHAMCADESGLFTEMGGKGGNDGEASGITPRDLVVQPVVAAAMRADRAGGKHRVQSHRATAELSGPVQLSI